MVMVIGLGLYASLENMNITYICLWGVLCAINCVFDAVALIAPWFPLGMVDYSFGEAVWKACVPVSYMLGAGFAWHLYLDYCNEKHLERKGPDPFGSIASMANSKQKKEKVQKPPREPPSTDHGHGHAQGQ